MKLSLFLSVALQLLVEIEGEAKNYYQGAIVYLLNFIGTVFVHGRLIGEFSEITLQTLIENIFSS